VVTVSDIGMPDALRPVGYLTGLNQTWNMFAPWPAASTHWYVMPGTLVDGRAVDLASAVVHEDPTRVKPVSWERPANLDEIFGDKYWRKYLDEMKNDVDLRRSFAAYVCRTWNAAQGGQSGLVSFEVVHVSEKTLPDQGRADAKRDSVVTRTCD